MHLSDSLVSFTTFHLLTEADEELDRVDIGKQFERVKWFLWHGNVAGALDTIKDIEDELDLLPKDGESRKKLLKAVREFSGYIEANTSFQIMGTVTGTERKFRRPSQS